MVNGKIYGVLSIKGRPLLTRMAAELFGTNQGFPINKARRELGYEPEVNFGEGMRRVEVWLHQIFSNNKSPKSVVQKRNQCLNVFSLDLNWFFPKRTGQQ